MPTNLTTRRESPERLSKTQSLENNSIHNTDRVAHDWYRFVLSFPPHLVKQYLCEFDVNERSTVLDPFCGTGTTVVECRKLGIPSIGVEANPMAFFASSVKVEWDSDPDGLFQHAKEIADSAQTALKKQGFYSFPLLDGDSENCIREFRTLPHEAERLLIKNSISPLPLHKTLVLLEKIQQHADKHYIRHEELALAKALVSHIGNVRFGPEVGVGKKKVDAPVVSLWLSFVKIMSDDLRELRYLPSARADVHLGDARDVVNLLEPNSVDVVITSPPYPNEKDYTRTTRLESVILGFLRTKADLRKIKETLIRSNTRNVYKADKDDQWVADNQIVQEISDKIESRRIALGKTSGFERLYHKVAKHYFGGMKRHLADMRAVLRPGAHLAYVVGDQASYLRIMIRTGEILGKIATSLGYDLVRIDLFRTRMATATGENLREEVVILRWPGK